MGPWRVYRTSRTRSLSPGPSWKRSVVPNATNAFNFHLEKEKISTYKIFAPYSTKVKVVFDKKKVCMPVQQRTDAGPIAIGQLTVTWVTK